ncbi:MAG: DUF1376 domain-containing protein [Methylobacter sp.]
MNYYERHLGDYARDTGHLSILEHGVYTLLLDRYYITESGIPEAQVYRLARAKTSAEKKAVDAVLADFFALIDGFWVNHRADEEIAKARLKIKSARENGAKGGRPSNNPDETQAKANKKPLETECIPSNNPDETQAKAHQTPDTNHQTPENNTQTHTQGNADSEIGFPARVCVELRNLGITQTNPSHADLLQLIRDGTTMEEFISAGSIAAEKGKGFTYLLGIVKGRAADRLNEKKQQVTKNANQKQGTKTDSGFAEKYASIGSGA